MNKAKLLATIAKRVAQCGLPADMAAHVAMLPDTLDGLNQGMILVVWNDRTFASAMVLYDHYRWRTFLDAMFLHRHRIKSGMVKPTDPPFLPGVTDATE